MFWQVSETLSWSQQDLIMDETDASLACVWVQLLTSHPSRTTACLGSSDFTREGSVARILSPEYGKACHEMGSWERSGEVSFEASPRWKMGLGEWWMRGHWECLSNGIKRVFSGIIATLWKVQIYHEYWCRLSKMCTFKYLISSGFVFFFFF